MDDKRLSPAVGKFRVPESARRKKDGEEKRNKLNEQNKQKCLKDSAA
jgi:hypothetical protein